MPGRPKKTAAQLLSEAAKLGRVLAQLQENPASTSFKTHKELEARIAKLRKLAEERK